MKCKCLVVFISLIHMATVVMSARYFRRDLFSTLVTSEITLAQCRAQCLTHHYSWQSPDKEVVTCGSQDPSKSECTLCWQGCYRFQNNLASEQRKRACQGSGEAGFNRSYKTVCDFFFFYTDNKVTGPDSRGSRELSSPQYEYELNPEIIHGCLLTWNQPHLSENQRRDFTSLHDLGVEDSNIVYAIFTEDRAGVFHNLGQTASRSMDISVVSGHSSARVLAISAEEGAIVQAIIQLPPKLDCQVSSATLSQRESNGFGTIHIMLVIIGFVLFFIIVIGLIVYYKHQELQKATANDDELSKENQDNAKNLTHLTLDELQAMNEFNYEVIV